MDGDPTEGMGHPPSMGGVFSPDIDYYLVASVPGVLMS